MSNAEALHYKKDHLGNEILDKNGKPIPVDFVSTGNNHHVAIYKDADGNLQEKVCPFLKLWYEEMRGLPLLTRRIIHIWVGNFYLP